jgi:hypothetical protein
MVRNGAGSGGTTGTLELLSTAPASHRIDTSGTGGASVLALARLLESVFHGFDLLGWTGIVGPPGLDAAGFHEALRHEHEVALATATRLGLRR